jgi:hypothetical protein
VDHPTQTSPVQAQRLVPLDAQSRLPRRLAARALHQLCPSRLLRTSRLQMTASSSLRPSTKLLLVCAATLHHQGMPTRHPTCPSRRTSTTFLPSRRATGYRPSRTSSQSLWVQHGMPTTTAAQATHRIPMSNTQCNLLASHLHSSPSPRQHQGLVSTSRPWRPSSRWQAAERTCCPDWSTTVATSPQRPHRPCPIKTTRPHTMPAPNHSAALAPGDVAATSTSKTTALLR